MPFQLKNYQLNAVNSLMEKYRNRGLEEKGALIAPTGSGKTIMLGNFIKAFMDEPISDNNGSRKKRAVLFFSFRVGLIEQNLKKIREIVEPKSNIKTRCDLLRNGSKLEDNDVFFLNVEKFSDIAKINNSNDESTSFEDFVSGTDDFEKIIIIDEGHTHNTPKNQKEYSKAKPSFIVYATATKNTKMDDISKEMLVNVDEDAVRDEGMIRKEVEYNDGLKESCLSSGWEKIQELKSLYALEGSLVNPLMLIQIPNGDGAEDYASIIEEWSKNKSGIRLWIEKSEFSIPGLDSISKEEQESVSSFNSPISAIVFKEKLSTGWDCPRAQVLVKFRDKSGSETFDEQVLGRITRSPEQKHYKDPKLNIPYVYYDGLVKDVIGNGKVLAYVKFTNSTIPELKGEVYAKEEETPKFTESQKLDNPEVVALFDKISEIAKNLTHDEISHEITKGKINEGTENRCSDENEAEAKFLNYLRKKSNGTNIFGHIKHEISIKIGDCDLKWNRINKVSLPGSNGGKCLMDEVLEKVVAQKIRVPEFKESKWIGDSSLGFPIMYTAISKERALGKDWKKIYLHYGEGHGIEHDFSIHLSKSKNVEGWVKNEDAGTSGFAIKYKAKDGERLFYPDFIVKYKNGKIGIYDTKGIKTTMVDDKYEPMPKYEALKAYCDKNGYDYGFAWKKGTSEWKKVKGDWPKDIENDSKSFDV